MVLAIGLTAVSFGSIFARLAEGAPPLVISMARTGIASLLLLPFAWPELRRAARRLELRQWLLGWAAGFFLAVHFATWIASLQYTSVAASLAMVCTTPIWVVVFGRVFFREAANRRQLIGVSLSVAGGFIIGAGDLQVAGQALFGDLLALAGGMAMALYLLVGRYLQRHLATLPYIFTTYSSATVFLVILSWLQGDPWSGWPPATTGWLLAMALIPQLLGHSSYNWALRYLGAAAVSVVMLGEPILSTALALLFLSEVPSWPVYPGGFLILLGIYHTARGTSPRSNSGNAES